ncbi:MAG TPA: DinB family protein [Galbitalea sp.]|nr:DinB family protein [Galbitalea sp.]
MASSAEILADAFERVRQTSRSAARDLGPDLLEVRLDPASNSIAWLVWHLARSQDAQVAVVMDSDQLWKTAGWSKKFSLPLPEDSTGYSHSADEVGQVRGIRSELLVDYLDAVSDRTATYVGGLTASDLDRIVDERFTPAVTLGVRLVSVISDGLQHAGQAAFIRGVLERR